MSTYRVLNKQVYQSGEYSIVPIRMEDRYNIMQWRNEQIYHLRQAEPLTAAKQDAYFKNVVSKLFHEEKPHQLLFSFLKGEECIGYGGLVHINWIVKNAEISFIMNTEIEEVYFELYWKTFLEMIEITAFRDLSLHKIFTYAFDLRSRLYSALTEMGFRDVIRLKDHCFFDGAFKDVLIHSKLNSIITLNPAQLSDVELTFRWASDKKVRQYSISKKDISFDDHSHWFFNKLNESDCLYFIAYNSNVAVGSFRVDIDESGVGTISYLLSSDFHGKGLGGNLLAEGINFAKADPRIGTLVGKVYKENEVSCRLFEKLAFTLERSEVDPLEYKMMIR